MSSINTHLVGHNATPEPEQAEVEENDTDDGKPQKSLNGPALIWSLPV